jgi:uncharacterized protein YecE (DUF72 family)
MAKPVIADLFGDLAPAPQAAPDEPSDDDVPAKPGERARNALDAATLPPAAAALAQKLPPGLHLGTSSWSFPGWHRLVYADVHSEVDLSRRGLTAYARHPLLRAVSIDRTFYAPLSAKQFAAYARQVPDDFRFIVKAPSQITAPWLFASHASHGSPGGTGSPVGAGTKAIPNPDFFSVEIAVRDFFEPVLAGLGDKIGALVLQVSPVGRSAAKAAPRFAARLHEFLGAISEHINPALVACELRDTPLLTPDYFAALKSHGARHCIGIHPRMPPPADQASMAHSAGVAGPLVARWNLHAGYGYEEAKAEYAPFDKLVDEDLPTRHSLAALAAQTLGVGEAVYITINNKAEGSAPRSVEALAAEIAARLGNASKPGADSYVAG